MGYKCGSGTFLECAAVCLAVLGISEPQLPWKEPKNASIVLGQSLLPFKNPQTPKSVPSFVFSEYAGLASAYHSPYMNYLFTCLFPLLDTMSYMCRSSVWPTGGAQSVFHEPIFGVCL